MVVIKNRVSRNKNIKGIQPDRPCMITDVSAEFSSNLISLDFYKIISEAFILRIQNGWLLSMKIRGEKVLMDLRANKSIHIISRYSLQCSKTSPIIYRCSLSFNDYYLNGVS